MPPLHFSGVEHSNTRHICPLCGLLCYLWASKSPQNKTCLYIFIFLRHGLELHKWPNNLATILLLLKHSFNQRLRQNNSISAFKLIIILCFDNDYESYCICICICICVFVFVFVFDGTLSWLQVTGRVMHSFTFERVIRITFHFKVCFLSKTDLGSKLNGKQIYSFAINSWTMD